jgi:signal transduction histidine kinase
MQDKLSPILVPFFVIIIFLILLLIVFIISILFLYQRRQLRFAKELEKIKLNAEKELFKAQLEMQEETFQYISQEIHDNVGQFLSLAKLHLNTLSLDDKDLALEKVNNSADLLTKALDDLRDLSKSLSSDVIRNGGFHKAIEQHVSQLQKTGRFHVIFDFRGDYHFFNEQKEIILFRILQEAINNIVRHSSANEIIILLCCVDIPSRCEFRTMARFDTTYLDNPERKLPG